MKLFSRVVGGAALLLAAGLAPLSHAYSALSDDTLAALPAAPQDFDIHKGALLAPILIPRVPGTPGNAKVRQHFVDFFTNTLPGWRLELHNSTSTTPTSNGEEITFVNVIATRDPPWARPGDVGRLALVAHYDSKLTPPGFIGATDSAAPCAMLMHTARSIDAALTKKWDKMKAEGVGEGGLEEERGVQIILLDGEEAFLSWTDTDSLYGARALAETWEATHHPGVSTFQTAISSIQLFVLLDLLGASSPRIPSYFQTTHWAYQAMAKLEKRLRGLGELKSSPNHHSKKTGTKKFDEPTFLPDADKEVSALMGGMVSDDHLPFMMRGVEILHMIPTPFPRVWHEMDDDGEHLDLDTVEDWAKLVTAFACEWMELEGFMDTAPASNIGVHTDEEKNGAKRKRTVEKDELPEHDQSATFEVPIQWDTEREFILYPDGRGGPVKLPLLPIVKRPSPEMVAKIQKGEPLNFLVGCKITPAAEISHQWGHDGAITLYDPQDSPDAGIEYAYRTDHLREDHETRPNVLAKPERNLFFITLQGDDLPTYHFWQDVKKDGDPRVAGDLDWASYMDACASRRASQQLEADNLHVAGELHRAREYFDDYEPPRVRPRRSIRMSKPGAASTSVDDFDFDDVFDSSSESNNHSSDEDYDAGVDFPEDDFPEDDLPEDDFTEDDFAEDGLTNDDNVEDSAPWWRFKFPLGSSSTYYKCPPHLTENPDADVAHLIDEFENNLRIAGIAQTLEDFAVWQKNAEKIQHFGGGPAPDKPPKREWPQNKAVKTVAYHLAIAANDGLPLLPLSGNEPWTRDDNIGFWTGKLPAGNIVSKRKISTLSELSDDSSSLFVPSRYTAASNGLLQANPGYGILKSPGSTAQPGPSPRSPRGSTGQFDVGGSSEGLVDDDLFFRDFDGDYTMVDAPPPRRRSSESPQLRRTPSKVRFDLPNGPSGSSDLGGGFAGPAFMMPKDGGLFGNESPFLEIKLYDGRLDADGTITLPDTSRRFRVWRWSDSTWGPDRARAQYEDFWRIAEELLGSQLQGPEDEVELRVYSEDGARSENDCIWVDRRVKPETFQEMMDAWLEYVTGSEVYLIPVPKVSRPFLPAASPGISYRALAKQFSTLQIAEGTRLGSVLHRARSFSIPNIPNAVAGTLSGWLRPQRASTVDEPDDVAFPPFDPTDCVDCGLYITTPDEYAEHYMKHFRGRIGAPQATHPGVQWALEQAGFQHSCPTCGLDLTDLSQAAFAVHVEAHERQGIGRGRSASVAPDSHSGGLRALQRARGAGDMRDEYLPEGADGEEQYSGSSGGIGSKVWQALSDAYNAGIGRVRSASAPPPSSPSTAPRTHRRSSKKKKLFPDSSAASNIFDESYTTPQHRLHRASQSRRPAPTPRGRRTRRRLSTASPISSTSPSSQAPAPAPAPPVRLTADELLAALSDDQENERVRRASLGPTFPSSSSSSLLLHRPGANSQRQRLGQYTPAGRSDDDAAGGYAAMRGRFRSSSSGYHHGLPPYTPAPLRRHAPPLPAGSLTPPPPPPPPPPRSSSSSSSSSSVAVARIFSSSEEGDEEGGITIPPALARAIAAGQPVAEIEVEWGEVVGASAALTAFWERVKRALELEDRVRGRLEERDEQREERRWKRWEEGREWLPQRQGRDRPTLDGLGEGSFRRPSLADQANISAAEESGDSDDEEEIEQLQAIIIERTDEEKAEKGRKKTKGSTATTGKRRRTSRSTRSYNPTAVDEAEDISDKEREQRIAMELEQNIAKQLEEEITAGKKRKRAGKADETYRSNKKVRGEEEVPEEKKRSKPNGKAKGSASIKKTVTIEVSREAVPESPAAKPKRKSTAGKRNLASGDGAVKTGRKEPRTSRTSMSHLTSPLTTLEVGPNKVPIYVSKHLLTGASPFFDKALNGGFKESKTNVVSLPTDEPDIVWRLVKWIDTRAADNDSDLDERDMQEAYSDPPSESDDNVSQDSTAEEAPDNSLAPDSAVDANALFKLWCLAERLLMPDLQDEITQYLLIYAAKGAYRNTDPAVPSPEALAFVYENSPDTARVRDLAVDMAAVTWDTDRLKELSGALPAEIASDLFVRAVKYWRLETPDHPHKHVDYFKRAFVSSAYAVQSKPRGKRTEPALVPPLCRCDGACARCHDWWDWIGCEDRLHRALMEEQDPDNLSEQETDS
ncbi:hypothetical protein SLS54_001370 [Diplodia seriata]